MSGTNMLRPKISPLKKSFDEKPVKDEKKELEKKPVLEKTVEDEKVEVEEVEDTSDPMIVAPQKGATEKTTPTKKYVPPPKPKEAAKKSTAKSKVRKIYDSDPVKNILEGKSKDAPHSWFMQEKIDNLRKALDQLDISYSSDPKNGGSKESLVTLLGIEKKSTPKKSEMRKYGPGIRVAEHTDKNGVVSVDIKSFPDRAPSDTDKMKIMLVIRHPNAEDIVTTCNTKTNKAKIQLEPESAISIVIDAISKFECS